jgi:hypothetical protein
VLRHGDAAVTPLGKLTTGCLQRQMAQLEAQLVEIREELQRRVLAAALAAAAATRPPVVVVPEPAVQVIDLLEAKKRLRDEELQRRRDEQQARAAKQRIGAATRPKPLSGNWGGWGHGGGRRG